MAGLIVQPINCTLKASGESSTDAMIAVMAKEFEAKGATVAETVRAAAFDIKPGVTSDEGDGDDWPHIREKILAADILVLGTPIWMGSAGSVAKRVMERMDAFLEETDDQGRMLSYGKVAVAAIVGNEDGAHFASAQIFQALNDVGWTIPAIAACYWVGEAMGSTDFKDLDETPEMVTKTSKMVASNAAHLATLLKADTYPGERSQTIACLTKDQNMTSLVRYQPDVEKVEPDEAETIRGLEEQFKIILDTTSKDYGHGVRSVHAKGHGIARGTLTVHGDLPPELAQGLFAAPGQYEAIFRLSTNAGDILDDSIDLPRGLALKILGVDGERLSGSEGDATQDFVMVNGPTFAAPTPKAFLANLKMLAKTTDKAEGSKKLLSGLFRAAEAALEAVGGQSAFLTTLGGAKPVHPLGATYYSQTPFRYGDYIAKFSLVPVSAVLKDLADATIDASGRPDAIRENVRQGLIEQGGTWEFRVQLCTDLEKMPIEDATIVWDEKASAFVTVATLDVSPQVAWQDGVSQKTEDELAFSPWHGLAEHQPLGGVNRARRSPYQFSANYRGRVNGCPMHEPSRLAELAG